MKPHMYNYVNFTQQTNCALTYKRMCAFPQTTPGQGLGDIVVSKRAAAGTRHTRIPPCVGGCCYGRGV